MIPQIQAANLVDNNVTQIETVQQPSKTYRDTGKRIIGKIDGIEAVKQTVWHVLSKERYAYPIYPDSFGMELEKYPGNSFEYLQAAIQKDLSEALTQDDRIYNVTVTDITKTDIDSAEVTFDVYSTEGILKDQKVVINV